MKETFGPAERNCQGFSLQAGLSYGVSDFAMGYKEFSMDGVRLGKLHSERRFDRDGDLFVATGDRENKEDPS